MEKRLEERCAAQLEARVEAVRHEIYEQLQDVRKCSGCAPSPPPPSPSPPPPSPSSPPPSPKPPCATRIDFALVLDESGSMKDDSKGPNLQPINGLKVFAKKLVSHAAMWNRDEGLLPPVITLSLILSPCEPEPDPDPDPEPGA